MTTVRPTWDNPSVAAMPWGPSAESTEGITNTEQVSQNSPPAPRAIPASSVEETIEFAKAHYGRALRRLAD